MNASFRTHWITLLLLICLPLRSYAAATLLSCQHTIKEPIVFQVSHSHSAPHSSSHTDPSSHGHFSCDKFTSCCLCCGMPIAISSFSLKTEKTLSPFLSLPYYQFIPEQPQRPPQTL